MNQSNCNPFLTNYKQINMDPYNSPVGVPLFPLYGYDNCEDIDNDMEYMKYLYPTATKKIQSFIDDECDKLEYEGSCMFDQYPDKVKLSLIVAQIYENVLNHDSVLSNSLETKSVSSILPYPPGCCFGSVDTIQNCSLFQNYNNTPNWLRNLIEIMLFQEMFNRRRRYRSRKRWF